MEPKEVNPTKDEIKLLIDNSLLEQEKRLSKEFRQELEVQTNRLTSSIDKQNGLYAGQIVELNKDIVKLNGVVDTLKSRVSGIRAQMVVVATACTTLGGLIGFFIAQIVNQG